MSVQFRRPVVAFLSALVVASCSGDGGTTDPAGSDVASLTISIPTLTISRGDAESALLNIARRAGYTGNVTFSASGTPSGVTVSFSPAVLTSALTQTEMTVTVAPTATAGTYSVTINAKGDAAENKSAPLTVVVTVPSVNLTVGAATATVAQGQSTTVGVTIARAGGFTGNVALAAEGVPSGVTATFAPAVLDGAQTTSTLTLDATQAAAVGSSTITIRASGTGIEAKTTPVQFTVTASSTPSISLSAAPPQVTIVAGQSGQSTITIGRSGGFTGNVSFEIVGTPPAGVTATFAPNNTATNSTVMTINTTLAAPRGATNLTVRATGTGVDAATTVVTAQINDPLGITLSLGTPNQTIVQGAQAANSLDLARLGGFAGAVNLSVQGLPAGVTTNLPTTLTAGAGALNTPFTVTVGAAAAPGPHAIQINATATGGLTAQATLNLTITAAGNYTLGATPAAVSVQQGQQGTSNVTLTRTGGFAGAVTLSLQGMPSGVTATFNPMAPTGGTSQMTVTVGSGVDAGVYNGTIRGVAAGLVDVTTPFALTVTASSSGAIAWKFCDAERVPLWFAYQDGNGAWTRVTMGANNTFSFDITQATGAVTYVQNQSGGAFKTTTFYHSREELVAGGPAECVSNPGTKSVTGTTAGHAGDNVSIALGAAYGLAGGGFYSLSNVADRTTDLLAVRYTGLVQQVPVSAILRRNQNPTNGAVLPVLDFGSAEAFTMASQSYNIGNTMGESISLISQFRTSNGTVGVHNQNPLAGAVSSITVYGVPLARTVEGDVHMNIFTASDNFATSYRVLTSTLRDITASNVVNLGPALAAPTVTTVGTAPYARIRAAGNWAADYNTGGGALFRQGSDTWSVNISRAYTGAGATYQLEIPDVSAAGGFNAAWALAPGSAVEWDVNMTNATALLVAWRTAGRRGSITP